MSSVRMCDRCATVFSERQEGWTTFTGSTRKRDRTTGKWITVSEEMDQCPDCTELTVTPTRPELLPSQVNPHYETTDDSH